MRIVEPVSGLLALAKPRRIKASHHRRGKVASGQIVQRYYDPGIGAFLSVDPVSATSVGGNFNRYWYANANPYRFSDPDGRLAESPGPRPQDDGRLDSGNECARLNVCLDGDDTKGQSSRGSSSDDPEAYYYQHTFRYGQGGAPRLKEAGKFAAKEAGWMILGEVGGRGLGKLLGGISRFFRISSEARQIASGHAFGKHLTEFSGLGIRTERQFARHIDSVLANPSAIRNLTKGRTAFWDDVTGTVVIKNPADPDGGTAFIPKQGRYYFDEVLH